MALSKNKSFTKYIEHYCESDSIKAYPLFPKKSWDSAIAIPCCKEKENILHLIECIENASKFKETKNLLLLSINNNINAHSEVKENNKDTIKLLKKNSIQVFETDKDNLKLIFLTYHNIDIILFDHCSEHTFFPEDQGVGLARKILNDLAFLLYFNKQIKSPWCFNTDADVLLPDDFFQINPMFKDNSSSALISNFQHQSCESLNSNQTDALKLYDQHLHYYKNQLEIAGSPYAFHTIGSTICINLNFYTAVRGYPKREAGEDFYILNKLAKVGAIHTRRNNPITIKGRPSTRVPFGTGPSIIRIANQLENGMPFTSYHPNCFLVLQEWIRLSSLLLQEPKAEVSPYQFHINHYQIDKTLSLENYSSIFNLFHGEKQLIKLLQGSKSPIIRTKNFHDWFDAFKTLKFIHAVRDLAYPNIEKPWDYIG